MRVLIIAAAVTIAACQRPPAPPPPDEDCVEARLELREIQSRLNRIDADQHALVMEWLRRLQREPLAARTARRP